MARPRRNDFQGAFHHVTARGNRRQPIYLDDADRGRFLSFLADSVKRYEWRCHSFCLMGNHFHLVLETPQAGLAAGMQRLNGRYAQTFNRRHGHNGHLFQARYAAEPIEREPHLLETCRYVVLNPVRAGACAAPEDWAWSSFRTTGGLGPQLAFLTTDWLLAQFADDRGEAKDRYCSFVAEGIGSPDVLTAFGV
jgi:putative transposase